MIPYPFHLINLMQDRTDFKIRTVQSNARIDWERLAIRAMDVTADAETRERDRRKGRKDMAGPPPIWEHEGR